MTRFKLLLSSLWGFLQPFVAIFLSEIGPVLAHSATEAVKLAAANLANEPGAVKRGAAFDMIVADLRHQGIELGVQVSTSMINAAIEAAVLGLKAKGN